MVPLSGRAMDPVAHELAQLILRARQGDRPALEALIARYQTRIAKFVIAQTGDDAHYEDVCQTIFVKMVLALPRLRETERFEPWLFQVARNACRDHLRGRRGWRRLFTHFDEAHAVVPSPEPEPVDENETKMAHGIDELPEGQRALLLLSLERGRSYEDLANLSKMSVPAVKSRLHRARESLRGLLLAGESK